MTESVKASQPSPSSSLSLEQRVALAFSDVSEAVRNSRAAADAAVEMADAVFQNRMLVYKRLALLSDIITGRDGGPLADVMMTPESISDKFTATADECFDNFQDAIYRVTIGRKLGLAEAFASLGLIGIGASGDMLTKGETWHTIWAVPMLLGGAGLFVGRDQHASTVSGLMGRAIWIPKQASLRQRFKAQTSSVLRASFTGLCRTVLSADKADQVSPAIERIIKQLQVPDNKRWTREDIQIALVKSLAIELWSVKDQRDMGGVLKEAVEQCPVRTVRGLLVKPSGGHAPVAA